MSKLETALEHKMSKDDVRSLLADKIEPLKQQIANVDNKLERIIQMMLEGRK